jgi:hypothetical protein
VTRAQAAVELRALLGDGDSSPVGEALEVAIRALSPAVRKATKTPVSRHVKAFLKHPAPVGVAARTKDFFPEGVPRVPDSMSVEARAQFAYKNRYQGIEWSRNRAPDAAVFALVLNGSRWSGERVSA